MGKKYAGYPILTRIVETIGGDALKELKALLKSKKPEAPAALVTELRTNMAALEKRNKELVASIERYQNIVWAIVAILSEAFGKNLYEVLGIKTPAKTEKKEKKAKASLTVPKGKEHKKDPLPEDKARRVEASFKLLRAIAAGQDEFQKAKTEVSSELGVNLSTVQMFYTRVKMRGDFALRVLKTRPAEQKQATLEELSALYTKILGQPITVDDLNADMEKAEAAIIKHVKEMNASRKKAK